MGKSLMKVIKVTVSATVFSLCCLLASMSVFAAGNVGGVGEGVDPTPQRTPTTDGIYEYGRLLFAGRWKSTKGMDFCLVLQNGDVVKAKRSTLRRYKKGLASELASRLRNCAEPKKDLLQFLDPNELRGMLYYLNKRHRLKLN